MAINQNEIVKTAKEALDLAYDALKEKGYNPIDQLTGYILSGDPSYITNNRKAKQMMMRFDRDEYMEELLNHYFADK